MLAADWQAAQPALPSHWREAVTEGRAGPARGPNPLGAATGLKFKAGRARVMVTSSRVWYDVTGAGRWWQRSPGTRRDPGAELRHRPGPARPDPGRLR